MTDEYGDTLNDDREETMYRCDPDEPEDTRDPRDEYDGGEALRFINF